MKSRGSSSRSVPVAPRSTDSPMVGRGSQTNAFQKRQLRSQRRKQPRIYLVVLLGFLLLFGLFVFLMVTTTTLRHENQNVSLISRLRDPRRHENNDQVFTELVRLEDAIQRNLPADYHVPVEWMVPLEQNAPDNLLLMTVYPKVYSPKMSIHGQFFHASRALKPSTWEDEWKQHHEAKKPIDPPTDYNNPHLYEYPELLLEPPTVGYPQLQSLRDIFQEWPQDEIDSPPRLVRELLQHFDYSDEIEMAAAARYRDRKLPFKLVNVPELLEANTRWTDSYLAEHFDAPRPLIQGKCQESPHHFFTFFQPTAWNVEHLGVPPTRNNDYTFARWADHARYADAVHLSARKPHFYWQAGVPAEERQASPKDWSFVSKDLPSFSSLESTFISPEPSKQKGIQCRFGERGVTTATHYDAGRNMIGMIHGAKRYILQPPRECYKLGIVTSRYSAFFRHSLLDLGKITDRTDDHERTASLPEERAWLDQAATSEGVETVLKTGEVLFVPSHWFHYIIGLQKNAQCNVRSGVDFEGDEEFGSAQDVSPKTCDPRTRKQPIS